MPANAVWTSTPHHLRRHSGYDMHCSYWKTIGIHKLRGPSRNISRPFTSGSDSEIDKPGRALPGGRGRVRRVCYEAPVPVQGAPM